MLPGQRRNLGDGLNGTYLVISVHNGDEQGVGANGRGDSVNCHTSRSIDGYIGDLEAPGLQILTDLNHCRMFDRRRNEVVAPVAIRERYAFDGVVIGLAAATGKYHFVGGALEQLRYLLACLLDGLPGASAVPVAA